MSLVACLKSNPHMGRGTYSFVLAWIRNDRCISVASPALRMATAENIIWQPVFLFSVSFVSPDHSTLDDDRDHGDFVTNIVFIRTRVTSRQHSTSCFNGQSDKEGGDDAAFVMLRLSWSSREVYIYMKHHEIFYLPVVIATDWEGCVFLSFPLPFSLCVKSCRLSDKTLAGDLRFSTSEWSGPPLMNWLPPRAMSGVVFEGLKRDGCRHC